MERTYPQIDVAGILRARLPRLSRFIPGFVVRALARLIRERELNEVLASYWHLPPQEFIRATFRSWNITCRTEGLDALDETGRYMFVANHPFGGMDGMMLADVLTERFGDVRVVVNDLLMNVEPLAPIWLPVNKHGRQTAAYARRMEEGLSGGMPVLTFPAGLCSRRREGVVADTEWRTSFLKWAAASGRTIVPVFVEGTLSDRFYRLSRLRERLGVKFNAEMILLPDEMLRQSGRSFRIVFGEPVTDEELAKAGSAAERVRMVRERVYGLREKPRNRDK
ncbi:MAG: 1-acyl-sn-glycerol-3-phosphate acyltransferase [Alistipes sp.]|nr:1-acyl-sn-glycerol-3-phosphate acyltransferase [Alistipes sp.]